MFSNIGNNSINMDNENKYCKAPATPSNGQYVCETSHTFSTENEFKHPKNQEYYQTGNSCRVHCNPTYSIPFHLTSISTIQCNNGAWNLTDIEFCYKEQQKRRQISYRDGSKRHLRLQRFSKNQHNHTKLHIGNMNDSSIKIN